MPKLEYFLVSESISVDREQNAVSIFNILEEVAIPNAGFRGIPKLVALSSWIFEPEDIGQDFQVTVKVVLPGVAGPEIIKEFPINFTAPKARQRIYHRISGLPLKAAGDVVFQLLLNGEHQASHTITVRQDEDDD
jgi:hypothetical protein